MKITERQKKIVVMFLVFVLSMSSMQITTYAHRAYFLQVLIDEGQMAYLGNLVFDNTQKESKKTEPKLWNYEGEIITNVESYDNLDKDNNGKSSMYFTFPPKPYKERIYFGLITMQHQGTALELMKLLTHLYLILTRYCL